MKRSLALALTFLAMNLTSFAGAEFFSKLDAYAYEQDTIEELVYSAAEYQLNDYGDRLPAKNWLVGTFFSSFVAAYEQTGNQWYLDQALSWSEKSEWDIKNHYHADDVCPAQTYLDIYFLLGGEEKYEMIHEKLSSLFGSKEVPAGKLKKTTVPFRGKSLWYWADALYMAPPVYARLGKATGDARYYEQLHELYWDTVEHLYSPEDQLFYRDAKYFDETTPNGKKVFWSRGNGWVIAGLARLIEYLPQDDAMRPKYIKLFQELAYGIARHQQPDGLWRPNINDPEWYTTKETTGTGFFVYAMTKGINKGWLPREYFLPVVLRGWSGLVSCVSPSGRVGYAQLVSSNPEPVRPKDSKDYGVGAFILAGVEMLKLDPLKAMQEIESATFQPEVVAEDGAWTWYNDERVIYHDGAFYASYVKSDGKTAMSTYALGWKQSDFTNSEFILSTWSQTDDHNNAAFLPLSDTELLITYATHNNSPAFFQRKLEMNRVRLRGMSEERSFDLVETRRGLTYQNLMRLEDEDGRIYNFFRGNNFNPHFVYSDDGAESWSDPIRLIAAGSDSGQRPYLKYVSNGKDRIDFFYSEAHPRNMKTNSLYHFYYEDGVFYNSTGEQVRTMEELKSKPISVEEGTLIFDGSTPSGRGWVWDLEYDQNGQPFGAFISSPSGDIGTDMRYWTARLKDGVWETEEIAFAGSNLYDLEQHYAGGIALDPNNDQRVIISANVNPATQKPLPNGLYQLFKGIRSDNGWNWEQLTFDPVNSQLRPVIVRDYDRDDAVFWFEGDYRTYRDYDCRIMMSFGF